MHLQSSSMKSAKTKEKENRSFTGDPGVSKNHATAHKHYSYESWLRIWNPGLFLIRTRGPFPFSVRTEDGGGSPALRFLANDGHAGGEGGVGEHQETSPHP
jgi:hypothetical protein